jgi:hypothetical protein
MLFDSRVTARQGCKDLVLTQKVNDHASFEFMIHRSHRLFTDVSDPSVPITVMCSTQPFPVFTGWVTKERQSSVATKKITAQGLTVLLTRSMIPPLTYKGGLAGFLSLVLSSHNQHQDSPQWAWSPGQVVGFDTDALVDVTIDKWVTPWEVLCSILTGDAGQVHGFLISGLDDQGHPVLHLTSTSGRVCNQSVRLTRNVIDVNKDLDWSGVKTRVRAEGAKTPRPPASDNTQTPVSTGDQRVSMSSVNHGLDYVEDAGLVARLGVREQHMVFDGADTPQKVLTAASEALVGLNQPRLVATVQVIDLNLTNPAYDALELGTVVEVDIPELGLSDCPPITETVTVLDNPLGSTITVGSKRSALSQVTARHADQVNELMGSTARLGEVVSGVESSIPTLQSELAKTREAAREAQTVAEKAGKAAADAAGVAGGKADVLIQDAEPDQRFRRATTLWIDTTKGGNTPRVWSGQAWVVRTDKAATDAAAAAVKAQASATDAKKAAVSAQVAADAAWVSAQQGNVVKDSTFATSSVTDHIVNTAGFAGADVGVGVLVFRATGFTGVVPSPASTYGLAIANQNYYVRGVNGGGEGIPTVPGRTYRFGIDVAHAASVKKATKPFYFCVAHRKGGKWLWDRAQRLVAPQSDVPDTSFTHYTWLYTTQNEVDAFRPGFGSSAKDGVNSEWWVTNFTVQDVTEAQAAVDAAADVAVTVKTVESSILQLPTQILSSVQEGYASKQALAEETLTRRTQVDQRADEVLIRVSATDETVRQVQGAVVAETHTREALIRAIVDGIEIGQTGSPTRTVYGNDGMSVRVDGTQVAVFRSGGAEVSQMRVRDTLQIGNRIIEANPAGGMWIRKA